ncbi:MAG: TorF family putative porin [Novosphingobium sp.]|nr:TorF family putative porin [Novosphingobium sp.]
MLTSVRSLLAATVLAGAAFAATPALAEDESTSDISVSGNVAIVSDYRFRGVSQSDGDFAIQGGIDISHSSGFYVGTWGSSIDNWGAGEMELDIYGGWSGEVTPGLTLDAGLLYYVYPAGEAWYGDTDFFEPYISLSTDLGPVNATVGVNYAWDQNALGDTDNLYIHGELEAGIPNTPISLSAHLGYTDGFFATDTDGNSLDWSLGASVTVLGGLSLGVTYTGVEGPSVKDFTDDAVVGTLSYSF